MITPNQIKERSLSESSHGYDIEETNAFISEIAESFSAIYNENKELYRKMEILAQKIEEYREEEESIKDTLLFAKKTARGIEAEAKERADKLLADSAQTVQATVLDAQAKAERIISEAREYAADITKDKAAAAQSIEAEAQAKADKLLSDAKADSSALINESKAISERLIESAKSEKLHYAGISERLKSEAEEFRTSLMSLYNSQLKVLESMVVTFDAEAKAEPGSNETLEEDYGEEEKDDTEYLPQESSEENEEFEIEVSEAGTDGNDAAEIDEDEADGIESEIHFGLSENEIEDIEIISDYEEEPVAEADNGAEILQEPDEEDEDEDEEDQLPFESFFNVKSEGTRTAEKISLIPPEDDEDSSDKFHNFFKKKKNK